MSPTVRRAHADDLRGAIRLAVEATVAVAELVEAAQLVVLGGPRVLGRPLAGVARLLTRPVHRAIGAASRAVGAELDAAVAALADVLGESEPGVGREATLAILNGVLGDHLAATRNPLAAEMTLRHAGRALDLCPKGLRAGVPDAGGKVLVLVHGCCLSDRSWTRAGHHHGAALARDLGLTAIHVQYNTGLHVSTNGAALAGLLERLVAAWPVAVEDLAILGHSMGGLVARSACHAGDAAGHLWRRALGKLVCLGSPHHGAALERGGHWIDVALGLSSYSAPFARLGRLRSAGVTDLRFGNVLDEHWAGYDRFAHGRDVRARLELPAGVRCYALAGTRSRDPADAPYASDGLVAVDSALGRHVRPELTLRFPEARRRIVFGTGHLDLLGSREVYEVVRAWLAPDRVPGEAGAPGGPSLLRPAPPFALPR